MGGYGTSRNSAEGVLRYILSDDPINHPEKVNLDCDPLGQVEDLGDGRFKFDCDESHQYWTPRNYLEAVEAQYAVPLPHEDYPGDISSGD